MAHENGKEVLMGECKFILYNLNFLESKQPKEIQSLISLKAAKSNVSKGEVMPEQKQEHVERYVTDDGREGVKITRNEVGYHSNTKVVEVFEDKVTPHVLTKRITEYTKPVVFKIKTELVNEKGEVVEVIIEELDENSDDFKMMSKREEVAPVVAAQSVVVEKKDPEVRHVKRSFSQMRSLSLERNKNTRTLHKVCDDCGGVVGD